ncbi:MAG TPA: hypothetical protein VF549_00305 [Solirubrobacteraceae bacterium]
MRDDADDDRGSLSWTEPRVAALGDAVTVRWCAQAWRMEKL